MYFFEDLVSEFFRHWNDIKTQIIINQEVQGPAPPGERMYNLLLVDSWKSFVKLDPASNIVNSDVNEFFHVVLQNRDRYLDEEIKLILEYFWSNYIVNVNVQVQTALGEIIVYTYFPFTKSHCGKVVPVEINRFRNGRLVNADLFPPKVDNMFGCTVRVATWNSPPYLIIGDTKGGKQTLDGFEGRLLAQLGDLMDFNIKILTPPNNEKRGVIIGNKTTGAARMLKDREADVALGNFWFTRARSTLLTPSFFYHQISNGGLFLTAPSYYSPIQALWFPFNSGATAALLVAFGINLIILLGMARLINNYGLPSVRHRNVFLNYIGCTLGRSTLIAPRRISGRTFLMAWLLFTFVIRTKYEAIIFHFMRNNMFRTTPRSMDEIVKLNYVFCLGTVPYNVLAETSLFVDTGLKHIIVNESYKGGMQKYMEDNSTVKLITVSPLDGMLYNLAKNRKLGEMSVLKKTFLIQNSCMFFSKHSYLIDRVNELILRISNVGLLDAWVKSSLDIAYLKAKRPSIEVRIDQNELKDVYYLCGFLVLISLLAFGLEILSLRYIFLRYFFEKII